MNFFLIITVFLFINTHGVAVEIYKVANDLSVGDFEYLFDFKNIYSVHIHLVN